MIRITSMMNATKAKEYYLEALMQQDAMGRSRYYSESHEVVGNWGGKGASRLGLSGEVEQAQFEHLCDNLNPNTGLSLTPRTKENRRVGYDFNFHCPKSVSLVHALTGDERILEAFREAVDETMAELECDTRTRVRRDGQDTTRNTGEMTWASFEHYTARPVDGISDPHLHRHVVVFNATWDGDEQRWKALDVSQVKRDSTYYEAAFHNRLAGKIKDFGFAIEKTANRWELAGIDTLTLEKFQERTKEIEKLAKELGIVNGDAKDALGAKTRENKAKDLTRSELREIWKSRLTADEGNALDLVARQLVKSSTREPSLEQSFEYAKKHAFERASVISEKRLMAHVLKHGVGSLSVESVNAEAVRQGNGLITCEIDGERLTTTPEVLREEQKMLAWAREGRGVCHALAPGMKVKNKLLSDEQVSAVRHVWESGDRLMMIRGGAGVGKTTLVSEVVKGIEKSGTAVFAFAPSADASRGTLREEGFKEADTLASLLTNKTIQEKVSGSVLWVDEAGQIGSRDMARLCDLAERLGCRVLLTGDINQHGPVARGDSMRLLETQAEIRPAEVQEIRRQSGQYKAAVKALSSGDIETAFKTLDELGFIQEIEGDERYSRLAADYVDAVKGVKGNKVIKEALAIAPTHSEGAKITAEIRKGLHKAERLKGEETSFLRLKKLSMTEAERSDAVNHSAGDVIQVTQNIRGFTRGERLHVMGRDESGALLASRENGDLVHVPLWHPDRLSTFRESELAIAKGETIRITENGYTAPGFFGKKHRLDNGTLHTVKGFTKDGDIKLSNGWVIPKDYGHLDYGYCQTSYSSQSRSVKRVFIAQGVESLPATDARQFYVSVSRGKLEAKIYTDSKEELLDAVKVSEQRLSAVELLSGAEMAADSQAEIARHSELMIRVQGLAQAQSRRMAAEAERQKHATRGKSQSTGKVETPNHVLGKPAKPPKAAKEHEREQQRGEYER